MGYARNTGGIKRIQEPKGHIYEDTDSSRDFKRSYYLNKFYSEGHTLSDYKVFGGKTYTLTIKSDETITYYEIEAHNPTRDVIIRSRSTKKKKVELPAEKYTITYNWETKKYFGLITKKYETSDKFILDKNKTIEITIPLEKTSR